MLPASSPQGALTQMGLSAWWRLASWWRIVQLGALILALALSTASHGRAARAALLRHIYFGTAPILWGFTLGCSLCSLVLIRIVVVTALSYGLSQYALEMVVRVLVLELIPLTAALFVALRSTLAGAADIAALRERSEPGAHWMQAVLTLRDELLPRALAGVFAVLTLAAVSCVVSLVLAYLVVYGFTVEGLAAYTRTVGHVFNPAMSLIFVLKTLFLSLAVAVIPLASGIDDAARRLTRSNAELHALVRLFVVVLLIEVLSLLGNYA
jgi:phospholipid/cholesterol/gamma-HCH transport system permease protein